MIEIMWIETSAIADEQELVGVAIPNGNLECPRKSADALHSFGPVYLEGEFGKIAAEVVAGVALCLANAIAVLKELPDHPQVQPSISRVHRTLLPRKVADRARSDAACIRETRVACPDVWRHRKALGHFADNWF